MTRPIRLGVLISGEGSNLQALLDAIAGHRLNATINVVVSNQASAGGLARATRHGVPTVVLDHRSYADRTSFDRAMVSTLENHGVEYVVLAGFMRIVTGELLGAYPMRVINIHPSLLPAFPGIDAPHQALRYGVRIAGCTVHFVDGGKDTGPIILQAAVPVLPDDTESSLKARILEQEHQLLPAALELIAQGKVSVVPSNDRGDRPRVTVDDASTMFGLSRI